MSFLVRFTPTSLTAAKYDEVLRQLEAAGDFPPDGMQYHVCFGSDQDLRVSEIWQSREQFEAFGERLMPDSDRGWHRVLRPSGGASCPQRRQRLNRSQSAAS